jgi:hypothetical protein
MTLRWMTLRWTTLRWTVPLLFAWACVPAAAQAPTPPAPTPPAPSPQSSISLAPIPRAFFGMHNQGHAKEWPDLPVGSHRGNPGPNWIALNPSKGVFDWRGLEERLARLQAHDADLLLNLGLYMPRWASSRPDVFCPDGNFGTCYPPRDMADWEAWVSAVVRQAAGRVKYWEIWNEPNDNGFWRGDMATMVDLARRAYRIIKAADPGAKILTPGVYSGPWGNENDGVEWTIDFLSRCSTGDPCADIVAYHAYPFHWFSLGDYKTLMAGGVVDPQRYELLGEQTIIDIQKYWNIAATFGLEGVWNTEGGLSVWSVKGTSREDVLDQSTPKNWELTGQFAVKATMLMQAGGVGRSYWYSYDNRGHGLLWQWSDDGQGTGLNPAGLTYRLMATQFIGATPVSPVARQETANRIRNPEALGAVSGTPGVPPDGWSLIAPDAGRGVNTSIAAGPGYIDIRVWGTPAAGANGMTRLEFESAGAIRSGLDRQWFGSFHQSLIAGSYQHVTVHAGVVEYAEDGRTLGHGGAQTVPATALDHRRQRNLLMTRTRFAGCASVTPGLAFLYEPGKPFDITLRLSAPRLDDGTQWTGTYTKADGTALMLAWDSSSAGSTLAVDPRFTRYQDLAGTFHPITGNSVALTVAPVFIVE